MNRYIDVEKLKAEIERLINQKNEQLKMFSDEDYTCSIASSINCKLWGNEEVLSLITSLQQEQPKVDLEKEIQNFDNYLEESGLTMSLEGIARHFYELGLNSRKEK